MLLSFPESAFFLGPPPPPTLVDAPSPLCIWHRKHWVNLKNAWTAGRLRIREYNTFKFRLSNYDFCHHLIVDRSPELKALRITSFFFSWMEGLWASVCRLKNQRTSLSLFLCSLKSNFFRCSLQTILHNIYVISAILESPKEGVNILHKGDSWVFFDWLWQKSEDKTPYKTWVILAYTPPLPFEWHEGAGEAWEEREEREAEEEE